jgi:alpha-beta hydrolase superfamily lysophospholipase
MAVAYHSPLAGWRDFLARDDRGRPFVLLGHSQGAAMLIRFDRW